MMRTRWETPEREMRKRWVPSFPQNVKQLKLQQSWTCIFSWLCRLFSSLAKLQHLKTVQLLSQLWNMLVALGYSLSALQKHVRAAESVSDWLMKCGLLVLKCFSLTETNVISPFHLSESNCTAFTSDKSICQIHECSRDIECVLFNSVWRAQQICIVRRRCKAPSSVLTTVCGCVCLPE